MTISGELLGQYQALTEGVGVTLLAELAVIEASGGDRVNFVHSFTTGDVKKLPADRGCEAFVTSPQGKTLGHVLVLRREASLWLATLPRSQAATLIGHFERYVITEDVMLRNLGDAASALVVAGRRSAELLRGAIDGHLPGESLAIAEVTIAGRPVSVIRLECAGSPSYLLVAPAADLPAVGQAIETAGALPCSAEALDIVRLEAGVPLFGQDITDDNLPQEIGRDKLAISFTKGCYLGQETVARIDALGHVNRQLVGLRFEGDTAVPAGTRLLADGKEVGHVTSAAWSPKLAAPLAIALVRRAQTKAGTRLASAAGDAVVTTLPLA